ncbi:TOTE conflict system archaeo-eukaryotic primase domain-containing protein [Jeotgalibaca arthritidis]|uniref:TOTE conflict system archaeo-eukaryotic primase domain-containing protein n=1 Tax=Jeotgalibaca arthritidis TaxID=1868794 RepID=UPI0035A00C30
MSPIDYEQLLELYNNLLIENKKLKEELASYKNKKVPLKEKSEFNMFASPQKKIVLFKTLFRGREDVYAKRFIHSQTGDVGYAPAKYPFWKNQETNYMPYDSEVVNAHLRGAIVAGIFPITLEDKCYFLAMDLDKGNWKEEASIIREVANRHDIPISIERSQSGEGAHIWFFFEEAIPASLARRFGTLLITTAMNENHLVKFDSYDRLFPNQDTLPKGGFGNLIALPLQKIARNNHNSVFIDENFKMIEDQWKHLYQIKKISVSKLMEYIEVMSNTINSESPLAISSIEKPRLAKEDFPETVNLIKLNQLMINKTGISQIALTELKRMAAFQNPEFYQAQAIRKSTWNIPRIISCSEEVGECLVLPRGMFEKVIALLKDLDVSFTVEEKLFTGNEIIARFKGELRGNQNDALQNMLFHDTGILCGTTAFGKTVVALKLIAERKVNTLILVNKTSLVDQWKSKIGEFLELDDTEGVGQLGGGKKILTNNIDIALLQSIYRKGEVHESIQNYGMVIVDECHHISAFSFESVLKQTNAKYVYGLTATPVRKDGHHPIIFMQCGPIRYQNDIKKELEKRTFTHSLYTNLVPFNPDIKTNVPLQELYTQISESEDRNQQIVEDVIKCHQEGRNMLVLTERVAHVERIAQLLNDKIGDVVAIVGGMSKKEQTEKMKKIKNHSANKPLTIVSTGKYIGEGFDVPKLDTLFLAMPISWKGRVQQYAGRLHRNFKTKREVRIYDYVDIHVPELEKMYQKRLRTYNAMGYHIKFAQEQTNLIYDYESYKAEMQKDIFSASKDIKIMSPSVTEKGVERFIKTLATDTALIQVHVKQSQMKYLKSLKTKGAEVISHAKIDQHFVIIDSKIIWYGNMNVLGNNTANSLFLRLESSVIVNEIQEALFNKAASQCD